MPVKVLDMALLLLIGLNNRGVWAFTFLILFAPVIWLGVNFRFKHVGADSISTHGSDNRGSEEVIQRAPLPVIIAEGLFVGSLARESNLIDLFDLGRRLVWVIEPVCITMLVVNISTLYSPFQRGESWGKWLHLRYIDFALLRTSHRWHVEQVLLWAVGTCIRQELRGYGNRAFCSVLLGNTLLHTKGPRQVRGFDTIWEAETFLRKIVIFVVLHVGQNITGCFSFCSRRPQ